MERHDTLSITTIDLVPSGQIPVAMIEQQDSTRIHSEPVFPREHVELGNPPLAASFSIVANVFTMSPRG